MHRIYPTFVSLLGAAGLASALAYFIGIYLVFQPQWKAWADFFVPAAIPLLLVPYVLLLVHLYLRTRLSQWLLGRGHVDEAVAYCETRLDHNLLRSRKESLTNRITLARAHIVRADYEAANKVLGSGFAMPQKGAQVLEIARWRMEAALRMDNLVLCHEVFDSVADLVRPKRPRAYLLACRGELAARESSRAEFDEAIDEALWIQTDNPRVQLAQVLGVLRFGASAEQLDDGLAVLETVFETIVDEIPYREAELVALRAELLARLGRDDEAGEVIATADERRSDRRSKFEVRRVHESITAQPTQHNPS